MCRECVNEGTVDGSAAVAGGISGLFEAGDMYGCVNVGDVLKGSGNAGGIVGTTQTPKRYTAITDCRNGGVICGRFGFHGIDIGRESQRHRQGGRLRCRRRRRYAVAGA